MDESKNIKRALTAAAIIIAEGASNIAPRRTGNLAGSIHVGKISSSGGKFEINVGIDPMELDGSVNYAPFVHNGTGIYGPKKKRIVPRNSKALKIPGVGYRKSTKGQKAQPFFDDAVEKFGDKAADEFLRKLEVDFLNEK